MPNSTSLRHTAIAALLSYVAAAFIPCRSGTRLEISFLAVSPPVVFPPSSSLFPLLGISSSGRTDSKYPRELDGVLSLRLKFRATPHRHSMSRQIKNEVAFHLSFYMGRNDQKQLLHDPNNRRNRMFNTSNTGKGFLPAMSHIDALSS